MLDGTEGDRGRKRTFDDRRSPGDRAGGSES
jgi:hypothetical protein